MAKKRARSLVEKLEGLLHEIERLPVGEYEPVCDRARVDALRAQFVAERERRPGGDTGYVIDTYSLIKVGGFEAAVAAGRKVGGRGILLSSYTREKLIWYLKVIIAGKRGKRGPPPMDARDRSEQAAADLAEINKIVAATGAQTLVSKFAAKMKITKRQARNRINVLPIEDDGFRSIPSFRLREK